MNTLASFTATDTLWMLVCACFVFFMQAGFTCYEAGLVQSKNVIRGHREHLQSDHLDRTVFSGGVPADVRKNYFLGRFFCRNCICISADHVCGSFCHYIRRGSL